MGVIGETWTWLTTAAHWSGGDGVWHRLGQHLYLTVVSLAISCGVALPVAVLLGHLGKGGTVAINISNAGRAVPTFAVLVLLLLSPLGRHGDWPVILALVLFAVPPLLTNAYVGMREVDRQVVEAARGMGMTGAQLVGRVELPLAFPLIMTGVRTAAVQVVATATLAALPGGGGLGRIITAGFRLTDTPQVVAGAVLVAALALLVEGALVLLERVLDPMRRRGRRQARALRARPGGGDGPSPADVVKPVGAGAG
ncbi:ABC transporter permease [Streptomyces sp. LX-29]|uniref:ABC transporter permease n=1 Tax=Streptomyces sp. LX-29 TaxID=2900152 RepID=UPI00240DBB48|nr:ABC transporter permease [Streptomyces sp. LX-29]WFB08142.1 ABC transporter permease [Streptomyces sp. LX-29]